MDDNQEGEGIRLHDDVIGDIMSRFRAKTIGQLRIKSSLIVSLTTSQSFIQKHLLFAKGDINQYGLLVFCEYEYDASDSPGGSYPSDEAANKEINRFSLNSFLDRDFSILWNPTTGGVKRTSSWNDLVDYPIRSYNVSCGFGVGELLNEYFGMVLYNVNDFEYLALIFKATTNSWRSVASFGGLNGMAEERMISVNFVVRIVETGEMIENQYILSFDPDTEMYRRLENPREHTKFSHIQISHVWKSSFKQHQDKQVPIALRWLNLATFGFPNWEQ